jgi:tetratricopeptide (TPR) repeat protein
MVARVWGYRARDVARMLDLPVEEVRRLAREGFASPRRGSRNELRFSFQDLVLLRAAAGLVHARVPRARVRRALRSLRSQLPEGRSLAAVRVAADGRNVVVQDGGARWRPDTGQVLLDFEVKDLAAKVAPLVRAAGARSDRELDADAWFRWGEDLEDAAPDQAREAYRRAIELDHRHAGAHLNLGRIVHEAGDARAAELHYRCALLTAGPARAVAAFNLGVALEDQELHDEALLAYARAIEADPALADAHFNLSRLLERLGRRADALRHLAAYRRLTGR